MILSGLFNTQTFIWKLYGTQQISHICLDYIVRHQLTHFCHLIWMETLRHQLFELYF